MTLKSKFKIQTVSISKLYLKKKKKKTNFSSTCKNVFKNILILDSDSCFEREVWARSYLLFIIIFLPFCFLQIFSTTFRCLMGSQN